MWCVQYPAHGQASPPDQQDSRCSRHLAMGCPWIPFHHTMEDKSVPGMRWTDIMNKGTPGYTRIMRPLKMKETIVCCPREMD